MNRRLALDIALTLAVTLFAVVPLFAEAQGASAGVQAYNPGTIVPQCGIYQNGTFKDCTFCDLMQLIQNILNFILFLAIISGGALFAYAGWLYATSSGSGSQVSRAHTIFKNVAIGLVVVVGAYTIVDTLMKSLAGGNLLSSWNNLCSSQGITAS
ncbi:MAG TPA: hypothetical protein VFL98_00130 [Candidatus Paceibacterota bacterium]|nr:hypothetical protein [Candidatus Paceibacterota bacterium]